MTEFRPMRRHKQAATPEECAEILRTVKRGVLAVAGEAGYPYALPLDFYYDEAENAIYFHCARSGHKIDAIKECDKVCFTVWNEGWLDEDGWSLHPTSVIARGRAELVDPAEDERILEKAWLFGRKYYPTDEELQEEIRKDAWRMQLVAIHIEHLSGKHVHER
ncbi:MAG: pyridoxamine 5'-phosphate oxidase family protein [Coriobacteriales bacterium]|jgi:nitroimidazol reductase NimA-like FMN-containing flavoprotein (pyridoxamine 5'-phosphate oxidase superfamily)